jgi:hypothetical protein
MKKYLSTIFTLFIIFSIQAQHIQALEELSGRDVVPADYAVFYGNFIQRLGFSSGGFPQDIRLLNLETKEVFAFRVKPTFKSAKENTFIYVIKPGTYAILNYWWTQSKWYGGKMFTEPIFKGIDATNESALKQKTRGELIPFIFSLSANSLNYLGTWHFDTGLVSFTDDKVVMDTDMKKSYPKLDFSVAQIVLPK